MSKSIDKPLAIQRGHKVRCSISMGGPKDYCTCLTIERAREQLQSQQAIIKELTEALGLAVFRMNNRIADIIDYRQAVKDIEKALDAAKLGMKDG